MRLLQLIVSTMSSLIKKQCAWTLVSSLSLCLAVCHVLLNLYTSLVQHFLLCITWCFLYNKTINTWIRVNYILWWAMKIKIHSTKDLARRWQLWLWILNSMLKNFNVKLMYSNQTGSLRAINCLTAVVCSIKKSWVRF